MVSNNDDNTDVMELAESLLLLDLSEQVPSTDTLPIDAPKQQDVIREINESHGVETEPIPSHPIPNPAEFNVPNIEPQGDLENTDDSDKTIIGSPYFSQFVAIKLVLRGSLTKPRPFLSLQCLIMTEPVFI